MSTVNVEMIVAALKRSPKFLAMAAAETETFIRFVNQIPGALAEYLKAPVTIVKLAEVKLAFLKYALENNFIREMATAAYPKGGGGRTLEEIIGLGEQVMRDTLSRGPAILKFTAGRIGQIPDGEKTLIRKSLNAEALALYEAEQLTIGALLMTQPELILLEK